MMKATVMTAAFAAALALGSIGATIACAQDVKVAENRQAAMKDQGKDMEAIKAFVDGKGELARAQEAGADLAKDIGKIPALFPAGTGMDKMPEKSWAKPVVWSEPDKFAAAVKNAQGKADALAAALKGGDKAAITAAFGDMGKNGCGACHEPFREKKPS
jgi:cytochrome c556